MKLGMFQHFADFQQMLQKKIKIFHKTILTDK